MVTTIRSFLLVFLVLQCVPARPVYADHRNRKTDSLVNVLKQNTRLSDKDRTLIYRDLMWGYMQTNSDLSIFYARKVVASAHRHHWYDLHVDGLRVLGMQAYGAEHFSEAAKYYEQALALTDTMQSSENYVQKDIDDFRSALYGSLGNLYNMQDQFILAIDNYQKALPIFEKYDWKESLSLLHHNLAELYLTMGNSKEARQHYLQAIEKGHAVGDSLLMAISQKGIAKIYIKAGNYQQASNALRLPHTYFSAHRAEEHQGYAEVLSALAQLHLMAGHENVEQAKACVSQALQFVDTTMMTESRCDIYSAAALTEMKQGHWQQALVYAQQAMSRDMDDPSFSDVSTYELLANIYLQLGRKEDASDCIRRMRALMDRFASRYYQSGISQMEVLYGFEKKQEAIARLHREKHRYFIGSLLVGALLLLTALTFFLLWRGVRLKRKSSLFKAKFDGEVAERSRIARDLHDSIGSMLTVLRLKTESGATKDEQLQLIDQTNTELRHVAHHLMPEQLLNNGLITALQDLAIAVPNAHFHQYGTPQQLDKDQEIVLYRCAYELLHNALKHAQADRIDIQILEEPHQVVLTVSDNGRGITDERLNSSGIGLHNIRDRINYFQGTLNIVSNENQGTEVNVILPL